ncbi:putative RNA-directed DNA polymerase [Helianthus annuus]|nr:putative RNA-directed DNA polymerase [Helianthus annuus]
MREFYECVQSNELVDIKSHGMHFTWNQKPKQGIGVVKKIDRIMGNMHFLDLYPNAYALFHPFRISDHTPCILFLSSLKQSRPKPFKFANFLATKEGFIQCVSNAWSQEVQGVTMFSVVKKLTNLKSPLRRLLYKQGNLHERVNSLRLKLDEVQKAIDANPFDAGLREEESICLKEFRSASYDEECFLKQKAKAEWLAAGDSNTKFFHNCVKTRNACNKILQVKDTNGNQFKGDEVYTVLVDHYTDFLGKMHTVEKLEVNGLFSNALDSNAAAFMIRQVTREEVKSAMFSIGENKAPGPDGYTSAFFKNSWEIVGDEVTKAILEFSNNGKLLQQINHTIIALVPKVANPNSVSDYQPISCCNVLYKCISKIITERIKGSLDFLVNISQFAFVPGRKISDNILLTQELMHNYHLNVGPPRCAFKIDIQKAYDTVSWTFLEDILIGFGFPPKMVSWIMTCVSTVSYSLSINGNLHGFFKGKRGLRQGDPISPYLFTLVMEALSLLLHNAATSSDAFRYHIHCKKQRIINVTFADDLFIFVNADVVSTKIIRDALNRFSKVSGLIPNMMKSTVFFGNVPQAIKREILSIMPFQEGALPVRYLGVPLISSKLSYKDCKVLVEKMEKKIDNWTTKSLSFAGRLQLVNSVLSAMHIYWATVFLLPARIVTDLEKRMRDFLWSGNYHKTVKPKVAWKVVCLPKDEGGLGIRSISAVNKALLSSHVWSILSNRNSLWVRWVHAYKLKGRSFWEIPSRGRMTWGWRKLLASRSLIRPFMWKSIGNGAEINAWSDTWCNIGPLRAFISPRRIANAGFSLQSSLADLVSHD